MESTRLTSSPPEQGTPSSPKSSPTFRTWESDDEYIATQARESTWSHTSVWGESTANRLVRYGHEIDLHHDDVVADFGGNDGFAAYNFYLVHKMKPIVVDCEPQRIEHASKVYGLPTLQRFLEHMPELSDKSVDWAYCSHTLEHCREPDKAVREMARIVKRQAMFVVPLENKSHAMHHNGAHTICFNKLREWRGLLEENGWKVIRQAKATKEEAHFIAEPA